MKKRIVVAMSGGVDSSTVAAMLKNDGHEVIGITMQLWDYGESSGGCCSADEVRDARNVARQIGIPHYVANYMEPFKKTVVADFVGKYKSGQTPVPCTLCNQFMKFDLLLRRTKELGADALATGHYARVLDEKGGKALFKGFDDRKDQTYFLFTLKQKELDNLMFPLGESTKPEVREKAREFGLQVAEKPESMGVCFLTGGDYRNFLSKQIGDDAPPEGEMIDTRGGKVGNHKGIHSYTVGQRKGLKIATSGPEDDPTYVIKIDERNNKIVVGNESGLYNPGLVAEGLSWVREVPENKIEVQAKIRHGHSERKAMVEIRADGKAVVSFAEPQRAVTPGQAVVFYNNGEVLGGGWIKQALPA
ncbi:MAG: tRNA 2-thiouridine(34) synthase MnmA [Candidatus Mycalebacterium zealandia]|nr:MAG: tRNA 2-thiouridine(34) synthase MnmA [Candidatus Mycalebacterium zealandia]